MPDEKLPLRTLKTSFWLAALLVLVFGVRGQASVAWGIAVGAGLGLFSLGSLIYVIPRLFTSANPSAKAGLGLVAMLKLPLYGGAIYLAVSSSAINPIAMVGGVSLVPAVLVLKVLGHRLIQRVDDPLKDETCRSKPTTSN